VTPEALLAAARSAAAQAYAPYSDFRVGAAVLIGDDTFTGCNIENASYGLTVCAERVAIFKAVSGGHRRIEALAVACIDAPAGAPPETCMPCGACRQVIAEFADPDTPIYVDGVGVYRAGDLLPHPFRLRRPAAR
jgi:cytidine deaminase